jgi:hypothetical protein
MRALVVRWSRARRLSGGVLASGAIAIIRTSVRSLAPVVFAVANHRRLPALPEAG